LDIILGYKNCLLKNEEFQPKENEKKILNIVKKEKIKESGDYNLTGDRYSEIAAYSNIKWNMVKLAEVCELLSGYAFKSTELKNIEKNNNYYPVVKIGNLNKNGVVDISSAQFFEYMESFKKYLINKGDILIAMTGATVGKVAVSNFENLLLNQRVGLIRCKKSIEQNYLKYLLFSEKFYKYCQIQAGGGAQGNISTTQIINFTIPLPPLAVQQEIVEELNEYQKIIDGARQVIENYKPRIEIDPKWEIIELCNREFFDIESGGTPDSNKNEYWNGDIHWITLVDLPPENFVTFIYDTIRKISLKGLKNSSAKIIPKESVLISTRATIGRIAANMIDLATNQGFKNIIIKNKSKINYKFIAFIMTKKIDEMLTLASGGTFKEISKTNLGRIKIPLPSINEQNIIVLKIEEEFKLIESNKKLIEIFEQKIKEKISAIWEK